MGVDFKCNLDTLTSVKTNIFDLREAINADSESIKTLLETLRTEWETPAATEFYKYYDDSWIEGVKTVSKVLLDLEDALNSTITEYEKIETEGIKKLKV